MKEQLVILIDSREQRPLDFGPDQPVRRATLETGDYSIEGYEDKVAVERKAFGDAYSCVGSGRRRFNECLARLARLHRAAIVIESDLREFSQPPKHTKIDARMAVGSYVSWMVMHRIPVIWCPGPGYAAAITRRFLMAYVKHVVQPQQVDKC